VTLRRKYRRILSSILPAGAVGAALLLGAAVPGVAREDPDLATDRAPVADRLAAIRQAVSEVAGGNSRPAATGRQLAWWGNWRNGGGWGAWRNGGGWGAWRNGGWRNGGWRNGGWPNFWRNW
jgi:rSAM-associated Gly-rich repeat protein